MILLPAGGAALEPVVLDVGTAGRWLTYSATLLIVGTVAFAALVRRDGDEVISAHRDDLLRRAAQLGLLAATLLLVAGAVRGYAQARAWVDPDPMTWAAARPMLLESPWGIAWIVQLMVALLALGGFALAARVPRHWTIASVDALLVAIADPLTGHALSGRFAPPAAVALHTTHLLGGGLWLGTLAVLFLTAWPATRREAPVSRDALVQALVVRFSPLALTGAASAAMLGLLLAYAYVGGLAPLVGTTYGRLLLAKVACLGAVAALGFYNWKRVTPALGQPAGTNRLARSIALELLAGAALLAATAILVSVAAPGLEAG